MNLRHPAPKAGALPAALHPEIEILNCIKLKKLSQEACVILGYAAVCGARNLTAVINHLDIFRPQHFVTLAQSRRATFLRYTPKLKYEVFVALLCTDIKNYNIKRNKMQEKN